MWLIDTTTLKLKEFPTEAGLKYAILSHRWGDDEVLFRDLDVSRDLNLLRDRKGFSKVAGCCKQARLDEYSWAWVDTCCIDKSSSAELSEAINSMFHWYRESSVCYVYLSDVDSLDDIGGSEWFKRGWTLQELLAPAHLRFFDCDWNFLSDKQSLQKELRAITSIPETALLNFQSKDYCIAEKMSWAAGRQTTREEDLAYCLMGIFDINMPLLYGERTKAFQRLQETIMESSTDMSIFLWEGQPYTEFALMAGSPSSFRAIPQESDRPGHGDFFNLSKGWTRNNAGVSMELSLHPYFIDKYKNAVFIADMHDYVNFSSPRIGIFLERLDWPYRKDIYKRVSVDNQTTIDLNGVKESEDTLVSRFDADVLIAREPMTSSSTAGSGSFVMTWTAPEPVKVRVCQRSSDLIGAPFENWPVMTTELAITNKLCFDYLRTEAQGILGHLLVSISDSLRLLVCFGFDVRFRPVCVAVICNEQFYKNPLTSWSVMGAYHDLFDNMEGDMKADMKADVTANVYAIRSSAGLTSFALFGDTIVLSLDIDTIKLNVTPQFHEDQKGWRSILNAESVQRQLNLFYL